jgi:hypothetical protein
MQAEYQYTPIKLLNPTQLKQNKDAETVKEILRKQELDKETKKSRQELAKAQAEFFTTLANNRDQWAKEETEHTKRMKEMAKEINELEEKKMQALIPAKMYEDQARQLLKEAQWLLVENASKIKDNDDLREKLEDKLDELGQREQDIALKEQKGVAMRLSLESQVNASIEATKALNARIAEFMIRKLEEEQDIDQRMTAVVLREQSISSKEDSIKRTEAKLDLWARQLADERATLERATKRISP